jgi:Peroxiredoxin
VFPRLCLALLPVALLACNSSGSAGDSAGSGSGSGTDSGGTSGTGGHDSGQYSDLFATCTSGESGTTQQYPAVVLDAQVTWTLTFDSTAKANGFSDCSYTRTYEGTQFLDMPYLCPDCDVTVRGTATMTEGADCYKQITSSTDVSARTELWGYSSDGTLYRSGLDQYPLGDLATFTMPADEGDPVDISWTSDGDLTSGGSMHLAANGTMSWVTDPNTLIDDPWGPRAAPYTCGWECSDPGTLDLDYSDVAVGRTMPDFRLDDQCGEPVDLWDFYGDYIVLDVSQPDCGPCQAMAQDSVAALDQMRADGIPVRTITLLGAGLAQSNESASDATVQQWIDAFGITDPVLKDKGYGLSIMASLAENETGESFGYPTWVVLDPQMKVLAVNIGYGDWDSISQIIRDDMGR